MHKFLLATNPLAPQSCGVWIIHNVKPICIINVVYGEDKPKTKNIIYHKKFFADGKEYTLYIHHYFTTDFNEEKKADELCEKILNRAWRWYFNYLIAAKKIIAAIKKS